GDPRWKRADFQVIFNGVVATMGSKSREVLNLTLRDKLQFLNTPITDKKISDIVSTADATTGGTVLNLTFGECHNVTPLLVDASKLKYAVHDTAINGFIEVRDNGIPVTFSSEAGTGRFLLTKASAGQITASVQGDMGDGTYHNTVASIIKRIVI